MCRVLQEQPHGPSLGAGGAVVQQPAGGLPGNAARWATGVVLGHHGAGAALLCTAPV